MSPNRGVMAKSTTYLNRARAYAATAVLAEDAGRRAALLQIAQHWRDLADVVEKHSASHPVFDDHDGSGASAKRPPTPKPDR